MLLNLIKQIYLIRIKNKNKTPQKLQLAINKCQNIYLFIFIILAIVTLQNFYTFHYYYYTCMYVGHCLTMLFLFLQFVQLRFFLFTLSNHRHPFIPKANKSVSN